MRGQSMYVASLADLYDDFKAGDDLQRLVDLILEPIGQHGTGGTRLLDVGCGTAASSVAFARRGFEVTGVDASPEMLAQARAKPDAAEVHLVLADMRNLPIDLVSFDVVNWMGDVVNHLLTAEAVYAAVACSARALRPGGLLVFDANSLTTFENSYTTHHVQDQGDVLFAWVGETTEVKRDGLARARIVAFHRQPDGAWRRTEGLVEERHHSPATVQAAIAAAGLEHVATFGLHAAVLTAPADEERHGKFIYVARAPAR